MTAKIDNTVARTDATGGTLAQRSRSAAKPSKINYLRAVLAALTITGNTCGYCGLSVDTSRVDRDGRGGTVVVDRRRAAGRQVTCPYGPRRDADAFHLAHVTPVSEGGTTRPGNTFASHRACNLAAGETDHAGDARLDDMVATAWPTGRAAAADVETAGDWRDRFPRPEVALTDDDLRAARRRRGWSF